MIDPHRKTNTLRHVRGVALLLPHALNLEKGQRFTVADVVEDVTHPRLAVTLHLGVGQRETHEVTIKVGGRLNVLRGVGHMMKAHRNTAFLAQLGPIHWARTNDLSAPARATTTAGHDDCEVPVRF